MPDPPGDRPARLVVLPEREGALLAERLGEEIEDVEVRALSHEETAGPDGSAQGAAAALLALEPALAEEEPDAAVVIGSSDAALAASLALAKLEVPVARLGAGSRSEAASGGPPVRDEVNGAIADRLAALLLCPDEEARRRVAAEGLGEYAVVVGDFESNPDAAVQAIRSWLLHLPR